VTDADVVVVRLNGGPASGAVLEVNADRVAELDLPQLTVTPAGRLYDRRARRYVPGAVVVERPDGTPGKPPMRGRPSTNLGLRSGQVPEHRPSLPRPPRATAPR